MFSFRITILLRILLQGGWGWILLHSTDTPAVCYYCCKPLFSFVPVVAGIRMVPVIIVTFFLLFFLLLFFRMDSIDIYLEKKRKRAEATLSIQNKLKVSESLNYISLAQFFNFSFLFSKLNSQCIYKYKLSYYMSRFPIWHVEVGRDSPSPVGRTFHVGGGRLKISGGDSKNENYSTLSLYHVLWMQNFF